MLLEKLNILGTASKWDSCGGRGRDSLRKSGIPVEFSRFVYNCTNTGENCRLMKVLQSNSCIHDCSYCANSVKGRKRAGLEPIEVAQGFKALQSRGIVEGLFLSSGVAGNAERTTGKMIESARILRKRFGFKGYLHLKVLPTTPKEQIFEMAELADRLSLNLEAPSKSHFLELGSTKDYCNDLEKRLRWIDEAKRRGLLGSFTTQLILGAAGENDLEVVEKMDWLYKETKLHRTYFSAFQPIKGTPLEGKMAENCAREHALYQADWLLRKYGFTCREIGKGLDEGGMFKLNSDVKMAIALNNGGAFPVDVNEAGYWELLKVPGIGPKTAGRIARERETEGKKFRELKELRALGVITRRASAFLQLERERQARLGEFC